MIFYRLFACQTRNLPSFCHNVKQLSDWSNDILARVHAISPENGTDK